jgi:enamine deaminase RidA (YjgF/YER057c/UK114 family)
MSRRLISSGSEFEKTIGYSRAVVDGEWVFVSGTTGFDYAAGTISEDVAEQTRQTLRNIDAALIEAGASMTDIVRANYIITDRDD